LGGCLIGWLFSWLDGWLVSWLGGWLVVHASKRQTLYYIK